MYELTGEIRLPTVNVMVLTAGDPVEVYRQSALFVTIGDPRDESA